MTGTTNTMPARASTGRIEAGFLRSKVARRTFSLFVLCALLPLMALAYISFNQMTGYLTDQTHQRLREASKTVGMGLLERMLWLETDLKTLAAHIEWGEADLFHEKLSPFRERLSQRFTSLALLDVEQKVHPLLGTAFAFPALQDAEWQHLETNNRLLVARPRPDTHARLWLVSRLASGNDHHRLLVGEIRPDYIWQQEDWSVLTTGLLVVDAAYNVIYSSLPSPQARRQRAALQHEQRPSGQFSWSSGHETYLAGYWTLFMRPTFLPPMVYCAQSVAGRDLRSAPPL